MLESIGRFAVRRHRLVLIVAVVSAVVAGALGSGVAGALSLGGFTSADAESTRARELLRSRFAGQPNLVLLVEPRSGRSVNDPEVVAAGRALTAELAAEPGVVGAVSYWSLGGAPPLRSERRDSALVLGVIEGDEDVVADRAAVLVPKYSRETQLLRVRPGGRAAVFDEVGHVIERDAVRAEMLALPLTLLFLVLVFGSVVAATLPLAIGVLSIVGTFVVLRLVAGVVEVSVYSLNLTTAMGLGLAIDYSLFIVSRYREEVAAGVPLDEAVVRSVRTAGRTVTFSALTVAVSLGALLVFPLAFLRSFAYAGAAVVLLATLGAVVVLPALLAALGPRVERWVLWRRPTPPVGQGVWHRIAVVVMRRPLPIAVGVTVLLLVLGAPFLDLRLGLPDDRVLPKDAATRAVSEQLRRDYPSRESAALSVVLPGAVPQAGAADPVARYAARLSAIDGVARVDAATGSYVDGRAVFPPTAASARFVADAGTYLSVVPGVEPLSAQGEELTRAVRAVPAPYGERLVAGPSAELLDTKAAILDRIPLAAVLIALATFVVLFLSFGSLVVPAKALVLNLLSLTATFGAMVWIFQQGNLADALGVTATGSLTATMPILMFCVAFGLSMDYEVFLLSRVKEEHDRTGDNAASVATGLERTGRIVTAAALLISVVFAAFAVTSGVSFMKMFGVGLTMAVVMDATLIRGALVPAFMKLAGEANWWAPAPLRRFHDRFGISDVERPQAASRAGVDAEVVLR